MYNLYIVQRYTHSTVEKSNFNAVGCTLVFSYYIYIIIYFIVTNFDL